MNTTTLYTPTAREEELATRLVHCAYLVHSTLGPGLLEGIYEDCLSYELRKLRIPHINQVIFPLVYDGVKLSRGVKLDLLIDDRVICEMKAVDAVHPVYVAQLLTQLKLTGLHLGFLINFNVVLIKEGIRRFIR